jgi:sugar lactone lactonase YvrE
LYFSDQQNHRIRLLDGMLKTVAGNGTPGFAGDGGPATAALLNSPAGMALTTSGAALYIADQLNHRIRKIDIATGVISTVAGNGIVGFSGDGGAGVSAQLSSPSDVALDLSGNLYIADTGNHRIRKLNLATGVINTIAGNGMAGFAGDGLSATTAALNSPAGLGVDLAGNVFIADTYNHRIRRVLVASGLIHTVAGNGSTSFGGDGNSALLASLMFPHDVAVDNGGDFYVSDYGHHRIRRVDGVTGTISTFIGNGIATFNGDYIEQATISLRNPTHLLITPKRRFVFSDTGNHRVRVIDGVVGNIVAGAPPVRSAAGTVSSSAKLSLGSSGQDLVFTAPQLVGTSAPVRSVILKNQEVTQTITITAIQTTGDYDATSNCIRILAPDDTCEILLTFTPSGAGERPGTLSIRSDIGGFLESLYLTSGYGIAAPGAPGLLSVTQGSGQATLYFSPPQNDGGSSILSFNATCGASSASSAQSPVTVPGLANGVSQSCTVRAVNAAGQGASSNALFVVPGAPANSTLTATIGGTGSGSINSSPATIACTSSCSGNFASGTSVTLTAVPNPGSALANWTGCDLVNGLVCTVTGLSGPRSVGVSFALAPSTPPLAPTLNAVAPGNAQAVLRFTPNSSGAVASSFRATCQPGEVFAIGLGSPLLVTGLTNNVAYSCSVRADNSFGASAVSASANVTPSATSAPVLLGAASRYALAAPATRDLPIDLSQTLSGNLTIEPRLVSGNPLIVFQLSDAIASVGAVSATDASMLSVPVSLAGLDGNNVLVRLPNGVDRMRIQVIVSGLNSLVATLNAPVGFLAGDVTASGRVTAADIAALKAQSGQSVNGARLRFDLNGDGQISSSDVSAAKARIGATLP